MRTARAILGISHVKGDEDMHTQTSIVRWGNSRAVRLPKALLETAFMAESDLVDITVEGELIIIKKAKSKRKHIPLAERLKNRDGKPYGLTDEDKEWLNMKPIGGEQW